jgi:hypothetical protein
MNKLLNHYKQLYGDTSMVDVNKYYESKSTTLKASDLPAGKEIPVTIAGTGEAEFEENGNKTKKLVLKFQGKEKGLALNKTNATTIAAAYGPDSDLWSGKKIFLFSTKVDFGGQMVDAIRVRAQLEVSSEDIPW